jgi:Ca-activated chloride channel homolog
MNPRYLSLLALGAALFAPACAAVQPPKAPPHVTVVAAPDPTPAPPAASDIVSLDVSPGNRFLRSETKGEILLRLRLGAHTLRDAKRPPINLALVVDTSGSMEGDAIRDAREASLSLVGALSEGDRLAVVSFNSDTEVLVPSTRLDKGSIAKIREKISAMKARGTTDLAGGLRAALEEASKSFEPTGINRIVLLGDGVPNDEAAVLPIADLASQRSIPVTVLGLGLDYNETLMNAVAQRSGGKYHFVRESTQVASVFKDEILRLQRAVARNTVVRLSPGPGVTVKQIIGLTGTPVGAATQVSLGDLSEGEERDVIVKLAVSGHREGSTVELLDADVSFDAVTAGGVRVSEKTFAGVRSSADAAEIASGRDRDVERSAARVAVAERIVRAIALARAGSLHEAQAMLDAAQLDARAAARELDDPELREKEHSIDLLRPTLPSLRPAPPVALVPSAVDHAPGAGLQPMPVAPAMPVPVPAAAAAIVMESQADAVKTIQGM